MKQSPLRLPPLRDLKIKERKVANLKPHVKNARTHSSKQLHQLAKSIETFGFTVPILIDDKDVILAGHGRVETAKTMGVQKVPTILIGDLSMTAGGVAAGANIPQQSLIVKSRKTSFRDGGCVFSTGVSLSRETHLAML